MLEHSAPDSSNSPKDWQRFYLGRLTCLPCGRASTVTESGLVFYSSNADGVEPSPPGIVL